MLLMSTNMSGMQDSHIHQEIFTERVGIQEPLLYVSQVERANGLTEACIAYVFIASMG